MVYHLYVSIESRMEIPLGQEPVVCGQRPVVSGFVDWTFLTFRTVVRQMPASAMIERPGSRTRVDHRMSTATHLQQIFCTIPRILDRVRCSKSAPEHFRVRTELSGDRLIAEIVDRKPPPRFIAEL